MGFLTRVVRFLFQACVVLIGCIVIAAVLGFALEAINWTGGKLGAGEAVKAFVEWWNTQSWSITGSEWIKSSGFSPGWLGYLLALILLALFGVFRSRK